MRSRLRFQKKSDVVFFEAKGWDAEIIEPEHLFFWGAYQKLRRSRHIGFGLSYIPFSEVAKFCDWAGIICPVQKERLARIISALDTVELEYGGADT